METPDKALIMLQKEFSNASFVHKQTQLHQPVIKFFSRHVMSTKIKLHLRGTNYQIKVWQALLAIPEGQVRSYFDIAKRVGGESSLASRAAGTAIGRNPIRYIIPCHRVIKSTGEIAGYLWGVERKKVILGWEQSKTIL